jgi:hypothetical protein
VRCPSHFRLLWQLGLSEEGNRECRDGLSMPAAAVVIAGTDPLRLGLSVRLARVLDRRPPGHDLIAAFIHWLLVVIPPALGQAVGEVVGQHPGLVDSQLLGDVGVGPGN